MGNSFFTGEDIRPKTDTSFVGADTIKTQYTYFAGNSYQEQVQGSTVGAFAQDNSAVSKDGVFIGENTVKKTDGSFIGSD